MGRLHTHFCFHQITHTKYRKNCVSNWNFYLLFLIPLSAAISREATHQLTDIHSPITLSAASISHSRFVHICVCICVLVFFTYSLFFIIKWLCLCYILYTYMCIYLQNLFMQFFCTYFHTQIYLCMFVCNMCISA